MPIICFCPMASQFIVGSGACKWFILQSFREVSDFEFNLYTCLLNLASQMALVVKNLPANAGDVCFQVCLKISSTAPSKNCSFKSVFLALTFCMTVVSLRASK